MTHIALIPVGRRFLTEHLTLVWMGNPSQGLLNRAEHFTKLLNAYISDSNADEAVENLTFEVFRDDDQPYRNFSGTMVAAGTTNKPLMHFRLTAVMLGLNESSYRWQPHITGENGGWRNPGEIVEFTHAELR